MIEAIYPLAIEQGVLPDVFWELSVLEVLDILEAAGRKHRREFKEKVERDFTLAEAIASRVGYVFTDKKHREDADLFQPWNAYPELFVREQAEAKEKKEVVALHNYKSGFAAYAERWNKRAKNGE